jgi:hypothetical protein
LSTLHSVRVVSGDLDYSPARRRGITAAVMILGELTILAHACKSAPLMVTAASSAPHEHRRPTSERKTVIATAV